MHFEELVAKVYKNQQLAMSSKELETLLKAKVQAI
jgi:hypothetical protein